MLLEEGVYYDQCILFIPDLPVFGFTFETIYNKSDFCVDHLVMSMYRVFSCVVGRGCLL